MLLLIIQFIVVVCLWVNWYKKRKTTKIVKSAFERRIKQFEEAAVITPEKEKNFQKLEMFRQKVENRPNAQTIDDIVKKLLEEIPEEKEYLEESIRFNNELLEHIYFEDDFTQHLVKLLEEDIDKIKIKKYCEFVEYMWRHGNNEVVNVFDVSIVESLATHEEEWRKFATYISNELIEYINEILIPNNILMNSSQILEKNE